MAIARAIRTISFLLTVLPSQVPNCYSNHFPNPPPADWWSWIQVGLLPSSKGGCNDLIISGHATVTSTLAWVSCSVCHHRWYLVALWMLVAMDYCIEIYEGFHYSVDMWLGAVLVSLIWHLLHVVEESEEGVVVVEDQTVNDQTIQRRDSNSRNDNNNDAATASTNTVITPTVLFDMDQLLLWEVIRYSIPAVVAYLQITVLPQSWVNYGIVGFLIVVILRVASLGFDKYVQHTLFCLLYLALGVYL